jgi:toxin ParE1/3/4
MESNYLIKYLPAAENDLTEIIEYVMLDNPQAAESLLNTFDDAISILALYPNSGAIPKDSRLQTLNYRMLVVDNYLVFYVLTNNVVEIRRILHGKRKYDFLL